MCEQGCTKAWSCFLRVSKEPFAVNLARNARCLADQVGSALARVMRAIPRPSGLSRC